MKPYLALATALMLAACGGGGGSSPPPSVPNTSSANGWTSLYSPGVTLKSAAPGGLISFAIPATNGNCPNGSYQGSAPCPQVDYVTTAAAGLAVGKTITMTGSIAASAGAVFNYLTQPDNNQPGGHAAACRLWFQETGDDGLGTPGTTEFYRWWANDPADVVLANGSFSVSAKLDGSAGGGWGSVRGGQASANPGPFAQAVNNAQLMGFTCGGGSFYGHGVNMSSGTATMTVTSYTVQ